MHGIWLKTSARTFLGLVIGLLGSAAFLIGAFGFWESSIKPSPPHTETHRTVIFFAEIGIYCATGLVFGIVNSLFISRRESDLQVVLGSILALVILLPFVFIEGHFVPGILIVSLVISGACGFFIKIGQLIVFKFRKIEE